MTASSDISEEGPPTERRFNFNTAAAIVSVVFAILLYVLIPTQIDKPLIVMPGSQSLSPELFPKLVAGCFLVLGIWLFFKSFNLNQRNELRNLDGEALVNVGVTLAVMAGYVFLMVNIGFVVGSALMIAALSTYYGNRNYLLTALISIVIPMAMFFVFRRVLLTELPPFPIDIYPLTHWSLI